MSTWIIILCSTTLIKADCPDDHYGVNCAEICPVHCSGPCHHFWGDCVDGCQQGWKGMRCDQVCEAGEECYTLTNPNSNNNVPNVNELPKQEECPENCLEGVCALSGDVRKQCTRGCVEGFTGPTCEEEACPDGWYGHQCYFRCPSTCVKKTCDKQTGNCLICPSGYTGYDCKKETNKDNGKSTVADDSISPIETVLIIVFILILFSFLMAVIFSCSREKKEKKVRITKQRIVFVEVSSDENETTKTSPTRPTTTTNV